MNILHLLHVAPADRKAQTYKTGQALHVLVSDGKCYRVMLNGPGVFFVRWVCAVRKVWRMERSRIALHHCERKGGQQWQSASCVAVAPQISAVRQQ